MLENEPTTIVQRELALESQPSVMIQVREPHVMSARAEPRVDWLGHRLRYADEQLYVDAPAVSDRGLITANGLANVEFARELFEQLGVLSPGDRSRWAEMFDMPGCRLELVQRDHLQDASGGSCGES